MCFWNEGLSKKSRDSVKNLHFCGDLENCVLNSEADQSLLADWLMLKRLSCRFLRSLRLRKSFSRGHPHLNPLPERGNSVLDLGRRSTVEHW